MAIRTFPRNMQPPPPEHPDGWMAYETYIMPHDETWQVRKWLREHAKGAYDYTERRYDRGRTGDRRLVVYFEQSKDAMLFKLTWGGQ